MSTLALGSEEAEAMRLGRLAVKLAIVDGTLDMPDVRVDLYPS